MNVSDFYPIYNAIDRLQLDRNCDEFIGLLRGKRCALVLNHTSRTRDGHTTLTVLEDLDIDVVKLFSPEHGLEGILEGKVGDASAYGRKVFSLYGDTRRPTAEMLDGVDLLIFDIQDIGARFYTYSSTMALCLEACAEFEVSMLVLDRANPLGGERIEGPTIDEDLRSFIGHIRMPIVHGMTMGELARRHRSDAKLDVDLHVLTVEGWTRNMTWPAFEMQWVPPSPNIPDFESADWYAGICLLEFNDISVGRGTPWPFQVVGAPWLDATILNDALEEFWDEVDLSWEIVTFTPSHSTHAGERCHGIKFSRPRMSFTFAPVTLGMALISALHATHPQQYTAELAQKCLTLLGSRKMLDDLLSGDISSPLSLCEEHARLWRLERQESLLYEDS